ncbi:MAG: type II toxin-antitoxin system HipA family toxin [Lachnospiraceae bacterium]|nr:type II toxin-antitoxin system HipA family toxin [Lachnospiraceae bacterium]
MSKNKTLDVYYKNKHVGTLAEMIDKRIAFQYDREWIQTGFSISPFSLPLSNEVFVPTESSRERFGGLFGVFADSLPDSWGELLLDRYLSSIGVTKENISTLDRLAYVGTSGMGALEYVPAKNSDFDIIGSKLNFDEIAKGCDELLSSKPYDQIDMLYKLGGSSGGTRPKIFLSEQGKEWIVKFPAKKDPDISGKREYDYSLCAKKCGIAMTETQLVKSSLCEGYFKTERFDRQNGEKIFTATFAGILEADFRAPSCDYETFMKLTRALTKDNNEDKEQMFKIMCFNVMTHNIDDHTKNFSFRYTENQGWRLAPAYDLTYSDTYWGEHTTSVTGKGKDILDDDLIYVGVSSGMKEIVCQELVTRIRDNTQELSKYINNTYPNRKKISAKERIIDLHKSNSEDM